MDFRGGEIVKFEVDGTKKVWRISKVDGNVVKIFTEDGSYLQMPYTVFCELMENSNPNIEIPQYF